MRPTVKEDLKQQRKQTDKVNRFLRIKDSIARPTNPGKVFYHPRHFNKPLSCQNGQHQLETRMWRWSEWYHDTIPVLWCRKCGEFFFKGPHEGTVTQRELRERFVPKPYVEPTLDELVEIIEARREVKR
jgi:hypothetical protein